METTFGQLLKQIRKEQGLSLRDVEKKTGISNAYLSQIESGKRNTPTVGVIMRLAKGYGISQEDMLQITLVNFLQEVKESPDYSDPFQIDLHEKLNSPDNKDSFDIEKYETLSDDGKSKLNDYLNYLNEKEQKNESK